MITAVPAGYLLYRAVRTRWHVLVYMSITLFCFAGTALVSYVFNVPNIIKAIISLDYPLFLTWFVRLVYTRTAVSRRHSTIVFIAVIGLKIVHATDLILFGVVAPAREPVSDVFLPPYFFHIIVSTSMLILSSSWYAYNSHKAYHEALLRHAPGWVIKRNKFVMSSAMVYILAPVFWLLLPFNEAGFSSPLYAITSTASLIVVAIFVVLTFLGWVTPEWLKRVLDKNYVRPAELATRMEMQQQGEGGIEQADQAFTSNEIIGIVDYIGQNVADVTKRSPGAMKGMLLLAIKTQLHDDALHHATFSEIEAVVKGTFKILLARGGIGDPEAIVAKVLDFLANNKANLMMIVA